MSCAASPPPEISLTLSAGEGFGVSGVLQALTRKRRTREPHADEAHADDQQRRARRDDAAGVPTPPRTPEAPFTDPALRELRPPQVAGELRTPGLFPRNRKDSP